MFTVTCCPTQERNAKRLKTQFGMHTSATFEKKTTCPECGVEIGWYLHSPSECEKCKAALPPFSEIYDFKGAQIEYYKGEVVRRFIWRGMPHD